MRRPRLPRRALGLTSLIDVIFLLLLFFMLSSTFSRFTEVPLTAGRSASAPTTDLRPRLMRLGADGVQLDGAPVADPVQALAGEQAVLITLAPEASSQQLVTLLAKLRGVDGLAVAVRP